MTPWFITLPYFQWLLIEREPSHELRFEKESRYYVLRLEQDLFNDWTITVINGRIKSKLGQSRVIGFEDYNHAFDSLCLFANIRHQRKYHLVNYKAWNSFFIFNLLSWLDTVNSCTVTSSIHTKTRNITPKPQNKLPKYDSNSNLNPQISFDF